MSEGTTGVTGGATGSAPSTTTAAPSVSSGTGSKVGSVGPSTGSGATVTPTGSAVRGPDGKFSKPAKAKATPAGTSSDASSSSAPGAKPGETAAETAKRLRFEGLKVYGEEQVWEGSEEDLKRDLQIGMAAKKRLFGDIRQQEERIKGFYSKAKERTEEVLAEMGVDPAEFARKHLASIAQREMMSPEQREAMEHRQRAETLEAENKRHRETEQARVRKEYDERVWKQSEPEFNAAIEEFAVPRESWALGMLAQVGKQFADAGLKHISPRDVVRETAARLEVLGDKRIASMSTAQLRSKLGAEKMSALIREHVEELKARQPFSSQPAAPKPVERSASRESDSEREYIDEHEFRRRMRAGIA
jgi:antitoxin component of RelBE/YafQ-DinJ toxin-antitoxin module